MTFIHINELGVKDTLQQKGQWFSKDSGIPEVGRRTRGRCPDGTVSASDFRGFSLNYAFPRWQLGQSIVSSIFMSRV